jgi:hypothetical protein
MTEFSTIVLHIIRNYYSSQRKGFQQLCFFCLLFTSALLICSFAIAQVAALAGFGCTTGNCYVKVYASGALGHSAATTASTSAVLGLGAAAIAFALL